MDRSAVRILVLDDEPFTLKLHVHILGAMGFLATATFDSGRLALEDLALGPVSPQLIFLDLSMPEMDGIEFMRHLVELGYAGGLVLLSGEDERLLQAAERLAQAHGLSVLGHLAKPVKPAALRALIEAWGGRSESARRVPGKEYSALEVRKAIRDLEVVNYYQPKVALKTGEIEGVEALARWQHPVDGIVSPGRFIATAEQHGLIDDMTKAIFRRAMSEMRELELAGLPLQVAINLTAQTLASVEFADFAAAEAARASVRPQNVVIEVTESELISDLRVPLDVLTRLRLKRFNLSIDDFGTGYSSFSQLRDFPFGELKIDQSFVHRAAADSTARAIYDASLSLARQLRMTTVAEGVENREDWDLVRSTECDSAQGFFIGRPMPPQDLNAWATSWRERIRTELR